MDKKEERLVMKILIKIEKTKASLYDAYNKSETIEDILLGKSDRPQSEDTVCKDGLLNKILYDVENIHTNIDRIIDANRHILIEIDTEK